MKSVAFHSRPDAARKTVKHFLVFVLNAATDVDHITGAAIFGIDGGKNVVEKGALVEFGVFDVGMQGEEWASHLEHVVHVAGFGSAAIHALTEFVGFSEVFVFAVAAGGIAMVLHHSIPKEACCKTVAGIAGVNEPGV